MSSHKLEYKTYSDYLQSGKWRKRKEHFVIIHPKICSKCSSTNKIECHHRTYSRIGEELDIDLMWFCHKCHNFVEKLIKEGKLDRTCNKYYRYKTGDDILPTEYYKGNIKKSKKSKSKKIKTYKKNTKTVYNHVSLKPSPKKKKYGEKIKSIVKLEERQLKRLERNRNDSWKYNSNLPRPKIKL
jgi:hypothetical protein